MFIFSNGKPKTTNIIQQRTLYTPSQIGVSRSSTTRNKDGSMRKMTGETNKQYTNKYNIWEYAVGNNKSSKDVVSFQHPATFPEQLAKDHIYSWSNEGDLVYDPFMGSGTTAKAAHLLKRKWIGSEISQEYGEGTADKIRRKSRGICKRSRLDWEALIVEIKKELELKGYAIR